jgi:hypothetical protein
MRGSALPDVAAYDNGTAGRPWFFGAGVIWGGGVIWHF